MRWFRAGWRPAGVLLLCLPALLAACSSGKRPVTVIEGLAMGTSWSVKIAGPAPDRQALGKAVADRFESIEQSMSTYRPDSELSRFNANSDTDWVTVSPELCLVVADALAISRRTAGAFDVTVGPLVDLWGFGPGEPVAEAPPAARIEDMRRRVGFGQLAADCKRPALRKALPDLHVDLSAIAKGYAVDAVAGVLDNRGRTDYLVELGGEVRGRGLNAARAPWAIGIESPLREDRVVQRVVHLHDLAMATSGDYRNYFEHAGRFYSHTINPLTGAPVQHDLAAVSVVAASTTDADAYATALLVLGADDGYRLADELGLAAFFQRRTATGIDTRATPAFDALSDIAGTGR